MFKSPTPTIPPLTKFKINFIPNLLSYDHFRMITVWIILYDRTVWSYDTVPWHRTLYYYDSISLLYCIILVIYRFLIGKILFSGSGICQSSYDEFSNILFFPRLVSNVTFLLAARIQKVIWITWICDEIFFGEIKRSESKKNLSKILWFYIFESLPSV